MSISNLTIKGKMPISPLLCLKFVNCQHCWQKATNSRLFCPTVAWGRLARVLLALPLLGETPPRTWCSGEHGESTPGTWEPGVEGVKGDGLPLCDFVWVSHPSPPSFPSLSFYDWGVHLRSIFLFFTIIIILYPSLWLSWSCKQKTWT